MIERDPEAATPIELAVPPLPAGKVRTGAFSTLRNRNFSLLFSGQLISVIGDQVYGLALPWTVLAVTGDARKMAIVLTASTVARVILLLFGGALSDRLNPRIIMLTADAGRVLVVGALGVTLFFGLPPLWIVASLAALEGAGTGLFGPGVQALLPRILPEEQLPAGNGLMMVVQYSTLTIGPLLGGIATAAQATVAFLADAASFVVSTVSLAAIRLPANRPGSAPANAPAEGAEPGAAAASRQGLLREIGAGLRYTFGHPLVRATMAVTVLANLGISGTLSVALIVLSHNLSPSPVTLGILLAAAGVGGIIGGLSAGLLARLRRRGIVTLSLYLIAGVAIAAIAIAAGPASQFPFPIPVALALTTEWRVGVIAGLLGLMGLIVAMGDTMILTVMQQRIAAEYMARVFSAQFLASSIAQPFSLIAAGFIAAVYGPGIVFIAGAAIMLLGIGLGLGSRALRKV